jgi:hypothetical protein
MPFCYYHTLIIVTWFGITVVITKNRLNSFSAGPYKRRTCTVYGTVYDFADSYLRFGACYVYENTTIRFSETISPNSYR